MNRTKHVATRATLALIAALTVSGLHAQPDLDFGGPPPFGPNGGGPGGMARQKTPVLKQFDKDGNGTLSAGERKAAREYLQKEGPSGARRGFGRRGGGFGESVVVQSGQKLSTHDVKTYPNNPLYDPSVVRTFFLQFEDADWEKELEDFHDTDVEVPARLTVDGKTYSDVGVHFRGMSSYGMVRTGQKRSLNLSLDYTQKDQKIGGYRTLNLLNSHEDPSFLRSVLYYEIAREYLPAPKANFVRVVINGESWGLYVNVEQFNKDFTKEWFGTTKGARWKVPGSPGARGSLAYLGDDPASYKSIYQIKSKDDPKRWADFIRLCKVLNETPADKLEAALRPILDVDGALRFIALDNALLNGDGYWVRTSDYSIYEDERGRFHIIPQDANETFTRPGGPGPGRPGSGPGAPFGGPGGMLAREMVEKGDKDENGKLSKEEFSALSANWFSEIDAQKKGTLSPEEFARGLSHVLPGPPGPGPGEERGAPRGGFGPGQFLGPSLFKAADLNADGSLDRLEFSQSFAKWFQQWDGERTGSLDEETIRAGLGKILPEPRFAQRGGRGGGRMGGGGPGNMPRFEGVKLDPLLAANDASKPLISKLLAVPELRARYLGYVRDIAEKQLDWNYLGPIARKYHELIAPDIHADTRKLDSTEDFDGSLTEDTKGTGFGPGGGGTIALKNFADQRRAYLLAYPEIQKLAR